MGGVARRRRPDPLAASGHRPEARPERRAGRHQAELGRHVRLRAGGRTLATFKSSGGLVCEATRPNLLEWKAVGKLEGIGGECPNLFPLQDRHVLILSTEPISYRVGEFDAARIAFKPGFTDSRVLDHGPGPDAAKWNRGLYGTTVFTDAKGRIDSARLDQRLQDRARLERLHVVAMHPDARRRRTHPDADPRIGRCGAASGEKTAPDGRLLRDHRGVQAPRRPAATA